MIPQYEHAGVTLFNGEALEVLRNLPDESVDCCVTSPPYWGLREYSTGKWEGGDPGCDHKNRHGTQGATGQRADRTFTGAQNFYKGICKLCGAVRIDKQLGLERTYQEYVAKCACIFHEVRRVLKKHGTCWVNLGDCYATGAGQVGDHPGGGKRGEQWKGFRGDHPVDNKRNPKSIPMGPRTQPNRMPQPGLKPKDLVGLPWRVAFALQEDGWYLRSDIVWAKSTPMPESVKDRCTRSHEFIFLLTKSQRYFYDAQAIAERAVSDHGSGNGFERGERLSFANADGSPRGGGRWVPKSMKIPSGWDIGPGQHGSFHKDGRRAKNLSAAERTAGKRLLENVARKRADGASHDNPFGLDTRNRRDVWTIRSEPFPGAHFAVFPTELPRLCIMAGCKPGGVVLDPFAGSGTTLMVAKELGHPAIGIELSAEYCQMIERRVAQDVLFSSALQSARD